MRHWATDRKLRNENTSSGASCFSASASIGRGIQAASWKDPALEEPSGKPPASKKRGKEAGGQQ